jgi:hypothetical protein
MTVNLSALGGAGQQFFDNSGNPLTGGKLYSYQAGTTTPQTTYTTAAGNVAHANPIILDSAGRVATGEIWLTAGSNYKFVLADSNDVVLATWDNITGINGTGITSNASNITYNPAGAGAVATTVQTKLREVVSVKDFGAVGDGVADDTTAFTAALASGKSVFIPEGLYLITSQLTVSTRGQMIYGGGYQASIVQRGNDSSFIIFNVTAEWGVEFHNFKIQEPTLSYTNTGSFIQCSQNGGTDVLIQGMWFWYGWQQIRCMQGTSNITFSNTVFEAARKGAIFSYSSARNKLIGCTFWKNSADISNPADRGYAVNFTKDPAYSFGSDNWNIIGNYFAENPYGPFLLANTSQGVQVTGNFFEIASQVDNGQKSDIELTSCTRWSIVGNTSDVIVNSYLPGGRGSKYCVDLVSGNAQITITGNTFLAGVSGTINDPTNASTRHGNTYTDSTTDYFPTPVGFPAFSGNSGTRTSGTFVGYEQGTWTPTLRFGGASVGQTYTVQLGSYTRIGRLVTLSCTIALSNKGSSTGNASIGGLPFVTSTVPTAYIVETDGGITLTGQLMMFNSGGSSSFSLFAQNNGATVALNDTNFSVPTIRFCISYEV